MIDEQMMLQWELDAEEAGLNQHAEIIRLARRYLALREHGMLMGMPHNLKLVSDDELDAAADRLLEGGK